MSADLERELRERLQGADLPSASIGLRESLETVVQTSVPRRDRRDRRRTMRLLAVAALIATGGLAILIVGGGLERDLAIIPTPGPSPSPSPSRSSSEPSSATQTPATPPVTQATRPRVLHELDAGAVRSVAAGPYDTCAIRPDRTLMCWGSVGGALPAGTYESLSVGDSSGCAVASDGGIKCWNSEHRPPAGAFRSVSVGQESTCAIRTDGTVACWLSGGFMIGDDNTDLGPQPPSGTFASVSVGSIACGIRANGTLACWGEEGLATPPDGSFSAVSVGSSPCAIRTDGELKCWAGGGMLGPSPDGSFSAVSVSNDQACAIRTDQTMACWGTVMDENGVGVAAPTPEGTWSSVSTGEYHACGVRTDNIVACWATTPQDAATPGPRAAFGDVPYVEYKAVRLTWSGTPLFAKLTTYDVEYRDGGPDDGVWVSLLSGTTGTETVFGPKIGTGHALRLRVHDADGLVSPWAESAVTWPADDTSLSASSGWKIVKGTHYYQSSAITTTKRGAKLVGPVADPSSIAIIATKCQTCGRVRVLLGDEVVATLDLHSSTRKTQIQCVFSSERDEGGPSRPLTIEVLSSGREITIDGYSFDVPCE
jgi:hypothetical protein